MYLVVTHLPIYVDGDKLLVETGWKRSLELLRDSMSPWFSHLEVLAPSIIINEEKIDKELSQLTFEHDKILLRPSISANIRARQYWWSQRQQWLKDVRQALSNAEVVHAGIDDVYKPVMYHAWQEANRQNIPTIFVQDMDVPMKHRQLAEGKPLIHRIKLEIYSRLYDRMCHHGITQSSLCLLKGSDLVNKYRNDAKRYLEFQNTMYTASDMINSEKLNQRIESLNEDRPLRFVYCGRLVEYKNIPYSIEVLAAARARGANLTLDIIGDGNHTQAIQQKISECKLQEHVKLLGKFPYNRDLLNRLETYDAIFFTPMCEDTPRMIFDGYCAGLPLIGTDIRYILERQRQENATLVIPNKNVTKAADILVDLDNNRSQLAAYAHNAYQAGKFHASENWYKKRSQATIEALNQHHPHKNYSLEKQEEPIPSIKT